MNVTTTTPGPHLSADGDLSQPAPEQPDRTTVSNPRRIRL